MYFVPWIFHDSNTNVLAILPIITALSHAIPTCSQQTAALWSPPSPVRSPFLGLGIRDSASSSTRCNSCACKSMQRSCSMETKICCGTRQTITHDPPQHRPRFAGSIPPGHPKRTPCSLHVTSRQHIHLHTTAHKDKLARKHCYSLWSAWQRSPSTSPPASLEFMSPCREYSRVLFGSIIPGGGVTTVTVVAPCAHCAGYLQTLL